MRRLALVLALLLVLPASGCLRDFDEQRPENRVHLRGIDVAAPHVSSGSVLLEVNTTLDNRGADSDPISLVVKAFDQRTGFLQVTETTSNRTIAEDKTVSIPVTLDVPRRSGYRIEVQVHEDGRIVETGRVTVSNVAALEPTIHETSVAIPTMEFLVRNVSENRVRIESQIYLTNEGDDDSRPLRMQVKARDIETGLLADQAWRDVASIPPEETRIHEVDLEVPDEHNYAIEAVLWEGNLTVERGEDTVQLLPTTTKKADEDIVVSDPRIEDFLDEDRGRDGDAADRGARAPTESGDHAETPGVGVLAGLAVLAATAIALSRRRWN